MQNTHLRRLTRGALIAALYVVFTLLSAAFGLSSGVIQCRLSEALNVFALYLPEAVPGLAVGCLAANLITGAEVLDVVFGALATFVGALGAYVLRKKPLAALWMPVVSNTLIIPLLLKFAYGVSGSVWYIAAAVAVGETVSCVLVGYLLRLPVEKNQTRLFK